MSRLANTVLVATVTGLTESPIAQDNATETNIDFNAQQNQSASTLPKAATEWMSCVRQKLESQGVTGEPLDMISASWRESTHKQYQTYVKAWLSFCANHSINVLQPYLQDILEFFIAQSKKLGYSAVNTARSALSTFITIDGLNSGDHPLVSRFMPGACNQNPALPRYSETRDPQVVITYLQTFPDLSDITLKQLTLKLFFRL